MELEKEMGETEWESCESSSGCDSGWTTYLAAGHSGEYAGAATPRRPSEEHGGEEEEEEDVGDDESLSMASDASSGPPHAHDGSGDYTGRSCSGASSVPSVASSGAAAAAPRSDDGKRRRWAEKRQLGTRQERASGHDCLDDTASSPFFFGLSKESFDLSSSDNCSRSSSNRGSPLEEAPELSCGFSETHLKQDQMQGGKKMRMASSILL